MALALVLSGLTLAASSASADTPGGARIASSGPLGGLNIDGGGADQTIAQAVKLHAKIVRIEVQWSTIEPRVAGQFNQRALSFTDRLMHDAAERGIGVIMLVDVTPCWASSAPSQILSECTPGQRSAANGWPPTSPSDFANFAGFLAARYGNELTALEVWNEPDQANERYFAGPNKAARYTAMLKAAYPAVKQADPNIKVLAGSIVGANGDFLKLLYKDGIEGYYDGLAVHFYTLTLASIRSIRGVQRANGDTTPLWLDEFGWTDCYPRLRIQEEQGCVTSAIQSRNLTSVYHALATTGYVAAVTMYELQDEGNDSFGVISANGKRKPAYNALAKVLASPIGPQSPVTVSLRRKSGRVIAAGSGPVGDFMELEAFKGKVLRYRAAFTLDRFNNYSLKLPKALGSRGLRVRVYQYWTGPTTGAQKSI